MGMVKYSFTPADTLNEHYLDILVEVAGIIRTCAKDAIKHYPCIVFQDFGSVLEQTSYVDYAGYYLKFRIAPGYEHLEPVKAAAERIVKRFSEMLKTIREPVREYDPDTLSYTVTIINDSSNIGD